MGLINVKQVRVFVTADRYAQWSKKTPTFRRLLSRFNNIQSGQWTEFVTVNHQLFSDLKRWFQVEER